jgi:peptide/nickel transport system permease protein
VLRYSVVRIVALFITIVIAVYLSILIANMGGHVDEIRRGAIYEGIALQINQDPQYRQLSIDERNAIIAERVAILEHRFGLDQPFIVRSLRYLTSAMTLDLGRSENLTSDSGSKQVRYILLERLPTTLVLFGTANLMAFFINLFSGLSLSRHYGSLMDKVVVALSPTSSAPAWFYGIFLILIFAGVLRILPFGGMVDAPPPENKFLYALSLGKHLILPVTAWVFSGLFLGIYNNRTFFLIYSMEDYVELARAKGLPARQVERRYILRPTLPTIITGFSLLLIALWTGAIITETVFNWPGIGQLYARAIALFDTPVIVANTVIYAYLLAITVFLLDFIYALVDPRVKIGDEGRRA